MPVSKKIPSSEPRLTCSGVLRVRIPPLPGDAVR
jgi:hypothetical protein